MDVYYKVKLNEKTNDIEKIKSLDNNTKVIYLLSNIQPDTKSDLKCRSLKDFVIDCSEVLSFAIDCTYVAGSKNKIFRKIKHMKRHKKNILNNYFQVIVFNFNENNYQDLMDLIRSIKVVLLLTTLEKYDYIYDSVCDYLDNEFRCKNICEFENDKCIAKRDFNLTCGCCRHYKSLLSNELIQCEYLINKRCSTKCITCKMFTCHYLVKHKGVKYSIQDIFLLRKFFNPIQKIIILIGYFTSKEKIMKRLLIWR